MQCRMEEGSVRGTVLPGSASATQWCCCCCCCFDARQRRRGDAEERRMKRRMRGRRIGGLRQDPNS